MINTPYATVGETRRLIRESEVAVAKITEKLNTLTIEEQADDDLIDALKVSRGYIEELVSLIDRMRIG